MRQMPGKDLLRSFYPAPAPFSCGHEIGQAAAVPDTAADTAAAAVSIQAMNTPANWPIEQGTAVFAATFSLRNTPN